MDDFGFKPDDDSDSFGFKPDDVPAKKGGANTIPGSEASDARPKYENTDTWYQKGLGGVEAAANLATGMVAGGVAPLVGLYKSATSPEAVSAVDEANKFAQEYTYQPRTETGQSLVEAAAPVMESMMAVAPMHLGTPLPTRMPKAKEVMSDKVKAVEEALKPTEPVDFGFKPDEAQAGPTLPNRESIGNVRTEVENPVAAAQSPMERMAAQLAPEAERAIQTPPAEGRWGAMADDMVKGEIAKAMEADDAIAHRDALQTDAVNRQTSLEMQAAERARQEAAPLPVAAPERAVEVAPKPELPPEPPIRQDVSRSNTILDDDAAVMQRLNEVRSEIDKLTEERQAAHNAGTLSAEERYSSAVKIKDLQNEFAQLNAKADALSRSDELPNGIRIQPTETGFEAVDASGKRVGYLDSNMTPEQNAQLRAAGENIPATIDMVKVSDETRGQGVGRALYDAWAQAHEGNIAPSGKTTQAAWDVWKRNYPEKVANFVAQESQRIKDGAPMEQVLSNVTDPGIKSQIQTAAYEPGFNTRTRKQGGGLFLGSKQSNVKAATDKLPFKDRIAYLAMDRMSPEQAIETMKGAKDVDQNMAQRAFNTFTKGSNYLQERLGNPLYKYVTDQFRNADNIAKGNIETYVHDMYRGALRKLNDRELTDVWQALKLMEGMGKRLSESELSKMGFNEKEINAITTHQSVMDSMVPKINEALDAVGMDKLHPMAAYVASKINGTFRKVMYDKDGQVIGALGDNIKGRLDKQVAEFKKLYPDSVEGPVVTMNRKTSGDITSIINFIADQDPKMAEFLKNSQDVLSPSFRGAKTHTMAKKGVIGMEGSKPWESAYTNAYEGFEAQVKYLTRMLEFAEKAKAEAKSRQVLNSADLNMPRAKELAEAYMNDALGRSTNKLTKGVELVSDAINESFGGWGSKALDVGNTTKKLINTKLLSLNPYFLVMNMIQPIRNMPEMGAYLGAKGAKDTSVMSSMTKVTTMMAAEQAGKEAYTPVLRNALKYAQDNHVYASDLLDTTGNIRRFGQGETLGQKAGSVLDAFAASLQKPAGMIEATTRKTYFLTLVDLLDKNGIKPKDGLYDIAANLTDRGMNRYTREEAPNWVKALGPIGSAPYNLMSYKFNELSRFASLAREFNPKELSTAKPFLTSLTMQIALGGLMGTMGYTEADWLVRKFSELYGKPTSLTKILLEGGDKMQALAYGGLSMLTKTDLSGRMGFGAILGSPDIVDMAIPGGSAVVQGAQSAYELGKGVVSEPTGSANTFNAKNAIMDIVPGAQNFERQLFPENDKNIGFNRRKAVAGFERNTADKIAKQLGATGTHEATARSLEYENDRIDQFYKDKQKQAVLNLAKGYKETGKFDPVYLRAYVKNEGNPENFAATFQKIATDQNIPQDVAGKMQAALQATTVGGTNKLMRRMH